MDDNASNPRPRSTSEADSDWPPKNFHGEIAVTDNPMLAAVNINAFILCSLPTATQQKATTEPVTGSSKPRSSSKCRRLAARGQKKTPDRPTFSVRMNNNRDVFVSH